MKENAEAQAVIIEATGYMDAISNFRDKYRYLPGDHPQPSRFFSSSGATAGNANNRWDSSTEIDTAWIQLYQSGFISQAIESDGNASVATPGTDRPTSRVSGAGWTFIDTLTQTLPDLSTVTAVSVLRHGTQESSPTNDLAQGTLVGKQHDYIDSKIDVKNTPVSGYYIIG